MKSAFASSALAVSALRLVSAAPLPDVSSTLQNILQNTHGSDLYTYPTDLTRDILPKPFHSHNDYWRDVPFYSALSYGAISTESDVWYFNGTLHVGHEISALTDARTFDSLYLSPILDTLRRQNPVTPLLPWRTTNGVFDTSSEQTLYWFVDIKTDAATTFPAVVSALEPLRSAGYLTTYYPGNDTLVPGPVTVIGTGNTGLDDVLGLAEMRDVFYDAPLATLGKAGYDAVTGPEVSPIASADFAACFGSVVGDGLPALNGTQLALLRAQVGEAHARGIKTRYWDQPGYPIGTRNAVWRTLMDEDVDLLNVDDLERCGRFLGERGMSEQGERQEAVNMS